MGDLSLRKKKEKRGNLAFINTYTQYIYMYTQFQKRELAEEISQWLTLAVLPEKSLNPSTHIAAYSGL